MTSPRRGLATATVGTAIGAGLLLLGASRAWSTQVVPQPPPLSAQEVVHTGASLAPALPALGLVALAGAGGLLATRGAARRIVGVLLALAAAGAAALIVGVLAGGGVGAGWPVACLLGAAIVASAAALTTLRGAGWPGLGRRYERPGPASPGRGAPGAVEDGTGPSSAPASSRDLWDALDRGEDPTRP